MMSVGHNESTETYGAQLIGDFFPKSTRLILFPNVTSLVISDADLWGEWTKRPQLNREINKFLLVTIFACVFYNFNLISYGKRTYLFGIILINSFVNHSSAEAGIFWEN